MTARLTLAYLVFEVRKPARWERYMRDMLGLPEPVRHGDDSTGWRVDEACQRLVVTRGERDDLLALGLECADVGSLAALVARLRAAGQQPVQASAALCRQRRVRELWQCQDPDGGSVELCAGLERAAEPFASPAFPHGFETGELGMGHVVLATRQLPAMEAFYCDLLGFGVTERLKSRAAMLEIQGAFLHCNRRHHSLALLQLPLPRRIHHFMLQARAIGDVGLAYERARALRVPIDLALGQHPDPDGTFSFYGETPSGFACEIGAQSREIDPLAWQTTHTKQTSSWGHQPQLRFKLKMLRDLVSASLARRRWQRPCAD
ncbi:MAG: VOC family protein [Burkholderiales bacterium]|nr:VOC family protein [Burkholderiales bacterium]